jgi:hypothetical protein
MDQNKTKLPKLVEVPKGIENLRLLKTHVLAVKVPFSLRVFFLKTRSTVMFIETGSWETVSGVH